METTVSAEVPVACTLEAGEFKERIDWIAALNQAALLSARREGLRLILTYRRDHAEHVGEMLRREQRCCSFLGFDLTEDQGGVTLVIEAPEGAADALDAIFEPFLSASPRNGGRACSTTSGRKGENNDGCCAQRSILAAGHRDRRSGLHNHRGGHDRADRCRRITVP